MSNELSDTAGRGRKLCSGCNKYPGVRSKVCPGCGASFDEKDKPALNIRIKLSNAANTSEVNKIAVKSVEPINSFVNEPGSVIVLTPCGEPQVKLAGVSIEDIRSWMIATRDKYKDGYLTTTALQYYIRFFHPPWIKNDEDRFIKNTTYDVVRAIIAKIDESGDK